MPRKYRSPEKRPSHKQLGKFNLQSRDILILETLMRFRVLRLDQIVTLCFDIDPNMENYNDKVQQEMRRASISGSYNAAYLTARRRLRKMFHHRILGRRFVKIGTNAVTSVTYYVLGSAGIGILEEEYGDELKTYSTTPNPQVDFLTHSSSLVDCYISFLNSSNQHGYKLKWITESELKSNPDKVRVDGEEKPVIPDAYVEVHSKGNNLLFSAPIEFDRGTMKRKDDFPLKIRKYRAWLSRRSKSQKSKFAKRYGHETSKVLTFVDTKYRGGGVKRLPNLISKTQEVIKVDAEDGVKHDLFLFAFYPAERMTAKQVEQKEVIRYRYHDILHEPLFRSSGTKEMVSLL